MNKFISIPNANRFPTAVATLIDREQEVSSLIDFLGDQRPLTSTRICAIYGERGSGKTELCSFVAKRLSQDYNDAQVYIKVQQADSGQALLYKVFELLIHLFDPLARLSEDIDRLRLQYLSILDGKNVLIALDGITNLDLLPIVVPPASCALLITTDMPVAIPDSVSVYLAGLSQAGSEKLLLNSCPRIGDQAHRLSVLCQNNPLCLRLLAGLFNLKDDLNISGCLDRLERLYDQTQAEQQPSTFTEIMSYILEQIPLAQKQFLFQLSILPDGFTHSNIAELGKTMPGGLGTGQLSQAFLDTFVSLNVMSYDPGLQYYRVQSSVQEFNTNSNKIPHKAWYNFAKIHAELANELCMLANDHSADGFLLSLLAFDESKSNFRSILQYLNAHPDKASDELKQNLDQLAHLYGSCRFFQYELENLLGPESDFRLEQFDTHKTKIILTGFMGTGKTTIGKLLADSLHYRFIDTDDLIEEQYGGSISDVFAKLGEGAFREMERQVVREIGQLEAVVISTGGRLMLDPENASILSRNSRVFCLVATPDEILSRVSGDTAHKRPLLSVPNPKERIVELLHQRNDKYRRFPQIVTDQKEPDFIAHNLIEFINTNPKSFVVENPQNNYEYVVGAGLLPFIRQLSGVEGEIVIVTDQVVNDLYGPSCASIGQIITIPTGRQHKTLATVQYVYDQLLEMGLDRTATIVALGGSVVGDITGYVAATYMRGINFIQCPTSLISMVDTSVGGKTAIDLPQGKNIIGVYKQPSQIIADVATLQTLSPLDYASGMAEIIKYAIIVKSDLLEQLENGRLDQKLSPSYISELQRLVAQAITVKINIVQADPFESGLRRILNLGHTFAYAIEQVSGNSYRHGEAVSLGLVAAANLSSRLGYCDPSVQNRIEALLKSANLPTRMPSRLKPEELLSAMQRDKKKQAGQLRFILISNVGHAFVSDDVPDEEVLATLSALSI